MILTNSIVDNCVVVILLEFYLVMTNNIGFTAVERTHRSSEVLTSASEEKEIRNTFKKRSSCVF
jgi:hypothetical protein